MTLLPLYPSIELVGTNHWSITVQMMKEMKQVIMNNLFIVIEMDGYISSTNCLVIILSFWSTYI